MHGMATSPSSFVLVDGAVPMLTTSPLSTMGDVMCPSPVYNEEQDVEWDKAELPILGWLQYASDDGLQADISSLRWHRAWRPRETKACPAALPHPFLVTTCSTWHLHSSFNVAMMSASLKQTYFAGRPWAEKNAGLESKLVFNMDGNGISGLRQAGVALRCDEADAAARVV
jgi:hypothetical protein